MLAGSSRAVVDMLIAVVVVVDRVGIHAVDSTHDADSAVAEGMDMAIGDMVSVILWIWLLMIWLLWIGLLWIWLSWI